MKVQGKKLKLNRETLRQLTAPELGRVVGATGICINNGQVVGNAPNTGKVAGGVQGAPVVVGGTDFQAPVSRMVACVTRRGDTAPDAGLCLPGAP